jgi:hypothetical protein
MARLSVAHIAVAALRLTAVVQKYFSQDRREGGTRCPQRVAHKQR